MTICLLIQAVYQVYNYRPSCCGVSAYLLSDIRCEFLSEKHPYYLHFIIPAHGNFTECTQGLAYAPSGLYHFMHAHKTSFSIVLYRLRTLVQASSMDAF